MQAAAFDRLAIPAWLVVSAESGVESQIRLLTRHSQLATRFGTHGEIRTLNYLFLKQEPLPIWPRVRKDFCRCRDSNPEPCLEDRRSVPLSYIGVNIGPGSRIRTCEHLFPKQAHLASVERPVDGDFGFGEGVEPIFLGSEPGVLPIRRPRSVLAGKAGLEPARFSLKN